MHMVYIMAAGDIKKQVIDYSIKAYSNEESAMAYEVATNQPVSVPLPLVDRTREIVSVKRGVAGFRSRTEGSVVIDLPSDFHHQELMDVNPLDQEAVIEFSNRYGLLWLPKAVDESVELPIMQSVRRDWSQPPLHRAGNDPQIEIGEIQIALRLLRAAMCSWIAYCDNASLTNAWTAENLSPPMGDDQAMRWFLAVINPGLVSSHPAVVLVDADDTGQDRTVGLGATHVVPFYDAICARIYNDIVTGAPYAYCENEPCNRRFLTKRTDNDRSRVRTTGLQYCSDRCKQNQDSRQYRRRQKAQQET
jgi:hypothetical protein